MNKIIKNAGSFKKFLLLAIVPFLISCVSPQYFNTLMKLRVGDDFTKIYKEYENNYDEEKVLNFKLNGQDYKVLPMYIITERIDIFSPSGNATPGGSRRDYRLGISSYYLIFENSKLVFWGFGYEMNRDDNPKYAEIYNQINKDKE